jgi:hypothetical protein
MKAIRMIRKVENNSLTLDNLNEFEGQNIELILLPIDDEQKEWARFNTGSLERAYGDDEPEYTLESVKERNPGYEGG